MHVLIIHPYAALRRLVITVIVISAGSARRRGTSPRSSLVPPLGSGPPLTLHSERRRAVRATKAGYSKEEPLILSPLPPCYYYQCPPSGERVVLGCISLLSTLGTFCQSRRRCLFSLTRSPLFSSLLSVHSVLSVCCTTSPEPPEPFS